MRSVSYLSSPRICMVYSCCIAQSSGDDAMPGGRLCWLVGVSFGLLCILQAILNISLRLIPYSETPDIQSCDKNLTEERDQFKRKLSNIDEHSLQGWLYFSHSLYYVSSTEKTWQDSRDDCLGRDADLVIINSKEEQKFLIELKKRMWIGLTDREEEGTWKWVDGSPLSTAYWGGTQPDDGNGFVKLATEDCAELNSNYCQSLDKWNDLSCHQEISWICEKMV